MDSGLLRMKQRMKLVALCVAVYGTLKSAYIASVLSEFKEAWLICDSSNFEVACYKITFKKSYKIGIDS